MIRSSASSGIAGIESAIAKTASCNAAAELRTTSPAQTAKTAKQFARAVSLSTPPMHLHLQGELGAGKTLWARALFGALGCDSDVPSPTFALALSYSLSRMRAHHLDLFRLPQGAQLPGELSELLQDENALCLAEWPERVSDLPPPDVLVQINFDGEDGRRIMFVAHGEKGEQCLRAFRY